MNQILSYDKDTCDTLFDHAPIKKQVDLANRSLIKLANKIKVGVNNHNQQCHDKAYFYILTGLQKWLVHKCTDHTSSHMIVTRIKIM